MNYNQNNEKINYITNILHQLDINLESIEKKLHQINQIFMKCEFNKNLKLTQSNSYLKFQVNILTTEKNYYTKIKNLVVQKIFKELYNIYNFNILLLISLENLDYGYITEKRNNMQKIIKVKKLKKLDYNKLTEVNNIINNNSSLIKKLLDLFEKFILHSSAKHKKKNLHTKTLKINLMNNKEHINLEYIKCDKQLEILIDYFFFFF